MAEYIDRETLLNMIDNYFGRTDPSGEEQIGVLQCRRIAREIAAADVAPVVHGRWLPCGFGKEIMCSVCRGELDDVWEYRHCPNCGAKMDL